MQVDQLPAILIVEDDDTDIVHFQRLIRETDLENHTIYAPNGDRALEILRQQTSVHGVCPSIVLTDLNMPGISGHEMIEDIRSDPAMENSVIFVISSSDLDNDMHRAYKNKIAGYFIKDASGAALRAAVSMLKNYRDAIGAGLALNS